MNIFNEITFTRSPNLICQNFGCIFYTIKRSNPKCFCLKFMTLLQRYQINQPGIRKNHCKQYLVNKGNLKVLQIVYYIYEVSSKHQTWIIFINNHFVFKSNVRNAMSKLIKLEYYICVKSDFLLTENMIRHS